MKQERAHKPRTQPAGRRERGSDQDAPEGRQEIREDIRKTWWPES